MLLSMPEDRLIASLAKFAGVPRQRVRDWLSGNECPEKPARAISEAVGCLGVWDDVRLIRAVLERSHPRERENEQ